MWCIICCAHHRVALTGVMNGGRCTCGDAFGRHGNAYELLCNVTCRHGWQEQNCGGLNENAIYRIVRGQSPTAGTRLSHHLMLCTAIYNLLRYTNNVKKLQSLFPSPL